jgi:RNA polymerase sigma-70 factor (ECF subfamily)
VLPLANFFPSCVYLSQDADDVVLVEQTLGGDQRAFELLIERHQRALFTVAARMLGSRDEAADATQNAFVRVYQHLGSYDPRHRFYSWIYRILVNECLNVLRGRRSSNEPADAQVDPADGPLEALQASERRRHVQQALLALPADLRAVIVLRHYAGLSYEEIGEAVGGLPVKTVKSRLYTARQRLGQLLFGWHDDAQTFRRRD